MSNINPNCDGSHCRHAFKEVREYPSSSGDTLYLCLPCFANENMDRYMRAKRTGRPEDCLPGQLVHCRGGLRQTETMKSEHV